MKLIYRNKCAKIFFVLLIIAVPVDFSSTLHWYTKQGLRVIAAATKTLSPKMQWKEVDLMARGDLEEKAEFLGLIVMQNSVKVETFPAIKALHDADINTVMVTGRCSSSMRDILT